jgi:hypothetical protein
MPGSKQVQLRDRANVAVDLIFGLALLVVALTFVDIPKVVLDVADVALVCAAFAIAGLAVFTRDRRHGLDAFHLGWVRFVVYLFAGLLLMVSSPQDDRGVPARRGDVYFLQNHGEFTAISRSHYWRLEHGTEQIGAGFAIFVGAGAGLTLSSRRKRLDVA